MHGFLYSTLATHHTKVAFYTTKQNMNFNTLRPFTRAGTRNIVATLTQRFSQLEAAIERFWVSRVQQDMYYESFRKPKRNCLGPVHKFILSFIATFRSYGGGGKNYFRNFMTS